MNLYERDYKKLTDEEIEQWEMVEGRSKTTSYGKRRRFRRKVNFRDLPKAVRHYESMFPNNYLDYTELQKEQEELHGQVDRFEDLLSKDSTGENQILEYINSGNYHIAASIIKRYSFGHHDVFLFKEFSLGVTYRPDYLLIGRNSGGYHFVFVEFESNKGNVVLKDGSFGVVVRNGIKQINDWKRWLNKNYYSMKEVFDKARNKECALPDEFYELDSTRIHYVVVAGRREDFNEDANSERRRTEFENRIKILHYDNLIDEARRAIGENTY